jgi:lanosterol synthase
MVTTSGRDKLNGKARKRGAHDDQPAAPKIPKLGAKTDISRWRMKDDESRHTWHYLSEEEAKEWKQSYADKYYLGLDLVGDFICLSSCCPSPS